MRLVMRLGVAMAVTAAAGTALLSLPAGAAAQTNQLAIFQDDVRMLDAPGPTLETLRELGVGVVRVTLAWDAVAPSTRPPAGFKGSLPSSYPAGNWSIYDQIVRDARADGIAVDFSVTGRSVRLAWSYPPNDPLLTPSLITPGDADTVYSRTVQVKVG